MRITERDTIGDLADDLAALPLKAARGMATAVRKNATEGNRIARANAKRTAGGHGKLYPRAFGTEANGLLSWEYGPDAAMPQGGMSFEWGSRNQPPHLDLNKSADIIGPRFAKDIGDVLDRLFW